MGQRQGKPRFVNFDNVKEAHAKKILLINTLPLTEQQYLIMHTIPAGDEETTINNVLQSRSAKNVSIIVYGKNYADESAWTKCAQLQKLGFHNTFLYCGGIFEWSLLQDIYGEDIFLTTTKNTDILKFKP